MLEIPILATFDGPTYAGATVGLWLMVLAWISGHTTNRGGRKRKPRRKARRKQ